MTKATSLYRYFDATGTLLYVGITSRRTIRTLQHAGDKSWWGEVASATFEHYDTRAEAASRELEAIRDERPLHNVVGRVPPPPHAPAYQAEAVRRWPDGADAVGPPTGDGRWATVAWCGLLSVMTWPTYDEAMDAYWAMHGIDGRGCGHACDRVFGGDHHVFELVDPPPVTPPWYDFETERLAWRLSHLENCAVCIFTSDGRAADAARHRHTVAQQPAHRPVAGQQPPLAAAAS